MGYEGQIAGLQDDVPGQASETRYLKVLKRSSIAGIESGAAGDRGLCVPRVSNRLCQCVVPAVSKARVPMRR